MKLLLSKQRGIIALVLLTLLVLPGASGTTERIIAGETASDVCSPVAGEPQEQQVTIEIRSNPSGADVYLDRVVRGKTPLKIPGISYGPHALLLKLQGFFDVSTTVQVRRDKTDPFVYEMSKPAVLVVTSGVPQAEVFIDDIYYGRTRFEQEFQPGELRVRVGKSGYRDTTIVVNFREGDRREIKADLVSLVSKGSVQVTTNPPDAEVYLNGKFVGKSPLLIRDVPVGSNIILVRKAGYPPDKEQTVYVSRDQAQVSFDFLTPQAPAVKPVDKETKPPVVQPALAHLVITVDPADAQVTVDGTPSNAGTIELKPGRHIVRAVKIGLNDEEETVDLLPGQTKQLPLTLSKPSSTTWLWYVAGVVVVGGAAAYLLTQGKKTEPPPPIVDYGNPPTFPVNPSRRNP